MSDELKPITDILVPMDFSEGSIKALEYAKRIAAGCKSRLHLLYVSDDPILIQSSTDQSFRDEQADKMCMKFIELLSPEQREQFDTHMLVRFGTAYYEIEQFAEESGVDLIVMGNVGRSALTDALVGSVTAHVMRHAPCPVLSVKISK